MESILNIIPAVMGLGVIDESLNGLLTAMETMPSALSLPSLMGYAKMIGLCIALGVGANECYQMMLGRRGMDVMKLLHIIIISLCISSAGIICKIAREPGKLLEGIAKSGMTSMNDQVMKEEQLVAQLQEDYINKVREAMQQLEEAQRAANQKEEAGDLLDKLLNVVEQKFDHLGNMIKEYALIAETKICEWISLIMRLIGEVLLQAILYGLLVAQRIFMHLLEMVAPVMFAISLAPHFKSAWSQWLSKYISISLWGFVTYVCMYYVFFIIWYNLQQDQAAYMKLLSSVSGEDAQVAAIGMQAVGSTCMYLIGVLVGVKVLAMVPEAASWLIPGGVSSSAGSAAAGSATAGASMIGGAAGAVGGMAIGAAAGAAGAPVALAHKTFEVAGTMAHGGPDGQGTSFVSAVAQNTSFGHDYNAGRRRGQDGASPDPAKPASYNQMKH